MATEWVAEIQKGCYGLLRAHTTMSTEMTSMSTTTAMSTTGSSTIPTTMSKTSTSSSSTTSTTSTTMSSTTQDMLTTVRPPPTTTLATTKTTTITTTTATSTIKMRSLPTATTTLSTASKTDATKSKTTEENICIDDFVKMNISCFSSNASLFVKEAVVKEAVTKQMQIVHSKIIDIDKEKTDNVSDQNKANMKIAAVFNYAVDVENIGIAIAEKLKENESIAIKTDEIEMVVSKQKVPFKFPLQENSTYSIRIASNVIKGQVAVVGVLHKNIQEHLPAGIKIKTFSHKKSVYFINSQLISCSIGNLSSSINVTIVLSHLRKVEDKDSIVCAFWMPDSRNQGHWDIKGCKKLYTADGITACSCNHLTNFALLTAVTDFEILGPHQQILDVLGSVCCWISIIFLVIGIVLFSIVLYDGKKHTRHIIHVNLMVTLCISQLIFVFGIEATGNKAVCQAVAYLLHYFLLTSFAWMLIEGLYLYYAVIKVFSDGKIYLLWYTIFGWGIPAIVVIITGSARHSFYGTSKYCWLSTKGNAIWGFLGPVAIVIVVNIWILILIIRQIVVLAKRSGVMDDIKLGVRSSLILLPILGVSWMFGFFAINSDTVAFHYIFSVTNGLQGFLVTLFHVFLNSEVRNTFVRKIAIWKHTSGIGKMFYGSRIASTSRYETTASSVSYSSGWGFFKQTGKFNIGKFSLKRANGDDDTSF